MLNTTCWGNPKCQPTLATFLEQNEVSSILGRGAAATWVQTLSTRDVLYVSVGTEAIDSAWIISAVVPQDEAGEGLGVV